MAGSIIAQWEGICTYKGQTIHL